MAKDLKVVTVVRKTEKGNTRVSSFIDKSGDSAPKAAVKPGKCKNCGKPVDYAGKDLCLSCYNKSKK